MSANFSCGLWNSIVCRFFFFLCDTIALQLHHDNTIENLVQSCKWHLQNILIHMCVVWFDCAESRLVKVVVKNSNIADKWMDRHKNWIELDCISFAELVQSWELMQFINFNNTSHHTVDRIVPTNDGFGMNYFITIDNKNNNWPPSPPRCISQCN